MSERLICEYIHNTEKLITQKCLATNTTKNKFSDKNIAISQIRVHSKTRTGEALIAPPRGKRSRLGLPLKRGERLATCGASHPLWSARTHQHVSIHAPSSQFFFPTPAPNVLALHQQQKALKFNRGKGSFL